MEEGKIYKCPYCDYACNNSVSITTVPDARLSLFTVICAGESPKACPEDQQASRQAHVRVHLLRPSRRGEALQEQRHEGVSIALTAGAQHGEEVLRRHGSVNCKEINFINRKQSEIKNKNR